MGLQSEVHEVAGNVIERTLWLDSDDERVQLSQAELLQRTEPLVILGEAGMGKSELLKWLAETSGYPHCTARKLINRPNPASLLGDAPVLVIDALDEVSSQKDGDAVSLVLQQLGKLNYPRFILSCRVADWRSSTGVEAIHEQYDDAPLELHLEPFDDADAVALLSDSLGNDTATAVVEHFNTRGLQGMLGNPQTLELIARVARSGDLPATTGALFERAIEVLRVEHRDAKAEKQLDQETGLSAAGAVCAGLLITGNEAIVRKSATNIEEGELQLAELSCLFDRESIENVLGSRLFKAEGADRFCYMHRRVGEFVAARWLAKQADTHRKRQRLLSLFHSRGIVPASLRGIHAWLAQDPALASAVIVADPMGVIEYGDADDLTLEQARLMIKALELLAAENPNFCGWGPFRIRGLARPEILGDIRRIVLASETPFRLSQLMLEVISGGEITSVLVEDLQKLVVNKEIDFSIRSAAGKAIAAVNFEGWPDLLSALLDDGDDISVQLALDLANFISYRSLGNNLIVDILVANTQVSSHAIGTLWDAEKEIPQLKIDGVLNGLAEVAEEIGDRFERPGNYEITDFAYRLIAHRVESGSVTAEVFWSWLTPFDVGILYRAETAQKLDSLIRDNEELRQSVQRLVLLGMPTEKPIWSLACELESRIACLRPNDADIIALLENLDPADPNELRWKQLIKLTRHDGEIGKEVRSAAQVFAAKCSGYREWLEKLSKPEKQEWQIEQEERQKRYQEKLAKKFSERRKPFEGRLSAMREGDLSLLVEPAKAYLARSSGNAKETSAFERVTLLFGEDIAQAAFLGFEAFIVKAPQNSFAQDIASTLGDRSLNCAGCVIVCALSERLKEGRSFDGVFSELLIAGLYEFRRRYIQSEVVALGLKKALENTLQGRGLWERIARDYYDPQLEAGCEYMGDLHELMRNESQVELGDKLATEWIVRFPDLPNGPEGQLIDRLIRSGCLAPLRQAAKSRDNLDNEERRRNWEVVRFVLDFEAESARLEAAHPEPELLWHFRNRTGDRFNGGAAACLDALKLEWIVKTFRILWPWVERPGGVSTGDTNPWDASRYIDSLIRQLGNDRSVEATSALARLRDATNDGYTVSIKIVIAEQARMSVESAYAPPSLLTLRAVVHDCTPEDIADLQTFLVEELIVVQRKIKSDDAESWRGFYNDNGVPHAEERCRDHLLGLLRQGARELCFEPEAHVAADKEVDIVCSVGTLRIPIEIKGQWHPELWSGADKQLDALYTGDWRAEGRGIYLVLWFGAQGQANKCLKSAGRNTRSPVTADELQEMLISASKSVREGRVKVVVLDVARENSSS
jgi:hypothetical protein